MALAELTGITKEYPGLPHPAVTNVSVTIERGEVVVLVGANGSGKTTLMEILCGLRLPTSGQVSFAGRPVVPGGPHRRGMGIQLQHGGLPQRLRVAEAVRAVSCLYQDPGPVAEITAALGLSDKQRQLIDTLSGGWQRRLDIALACIGKPELLLLDEPTSGLDPVARAELWEFLRGRRAEGTAVFASTHDLAEAEAFADRLLLLESGNLILAGSVPEVLAAAGGDTRVRVTDASPAVAEAVTAAGLTPLRSGAAISVIADKGALLPLRDTLEQQRELNQLDYTDLVLGPVRLEDIFAFASTTQATGGES